MRKIKKRKGKSRGKGKRYTGKKKEIHGARALTLGSPRIHDISGVS